MPWFKVDDNLAFHHKTVAAGNAAMGLWVRAGAMSANQLTDGFVPDHMAAALGSPSQAARLVKVGLWERVEKGYQFHQWNDRNPSKESVEAKREQARERMASIRAQRQVKPGGSREQDANAQRTSREVRSPRPDPTRPDPKEDLPLLAAPKSKARTTDVVPEGFEGWWDTYAKKVGRKAALSAYKRAIKKVSADDLLAAASAYVARKRTAGAHPQFTKDPASWLNGEHWNDELAGAPERPATIYPDARTIESPPDGLSDEEYRQWWLDRRAQ